MKHLLLCLLFLALLTSCASVKLGDAAGRWELERSNLDTTHTTPMFVAIAVKDSRASITTLDVRDSILNVVRYHYTPITGKAVAFPGNPRDYGVQLKRKHVRLTDNHGNYLIYTRADSTQTPKPR